MHAIEVEKNGKLLLTVGVESAVMFSVDISTSAMEQGASLDIRGMIDLGNDRSAHISWLELDPLTTGDDVTLRFVETSKVSDLISSTATDSEDYIARQAAYDALLANEPPTPQVYEVTQQSAAIQLTVGEAAPIIAVLESGREFISFHAMWDQWRPKQCRIWLSSFSQEEALAREGSRKWHESRLNIGDHCNVKFTA